MVNHPPDMDERLISRARSGGSVRVLSIVNILVRAPAF
jgi:hypothetical protein